MFKVFGNKLLEFLFQKAWGWFIMTMTTSAIFAKLLSVAQHPIFHEQIVIWLTFFFVLCITLWSVLAVYILLDKRNKNPETFVGFILEQNNRLGECSVNNIRYHYQIYPTQNNILIYDVVFAFIKPINITTVRVYGFNGGKPTYHVPEYNPHFVRIIIQDIPNNKFFITFNEKREDEFKRSAT